MQTTHPVSYSADLDQPIPYKLSALALAALANGVAFEDVEAFVSAGKSYNRACNLEAEETYQRELDIALHKSASAGEPERSVLFWKAASL